jgi:hypothetical protein
MSTQAARKAGATATKPAATTAPTPAPFVPDYAAICTAFREDAAKHATKPVSLGAEQYEAQSKDPAFLQPLEDQETAATVLRIRINAGLALSPLSPEARRIVANAEAAGISFDPARRDA